MKSTVTPLILAFLLLAAGGVLWTLGQAQDRIALAKTEIATMEFGAVAHENPGNYDGQDADELEHSLGYAGRVPVLGTNMTSEAKDARVTAAYWLGRYDALALERDAGGAPVEHDPKALLLAANAGYRASRLDTVDRQAALERLESIIRNYVDVLKISVGNGGDSESPDGHVGHVLNDAAYNYEFAVRARDALERARPNTPPAPTAGNEPPPSIHGRPGGPPKNADASKFKIVVPKRSDERNDNPEGGQGQEKVRKG